MQQVNLKELLDSVDKSERSDWLTIWEKETVDYLVAYEDPKGKCTIRAVGPFQTLKTLAKAIAEKTHGRAHAYTPSMTFAIRSLDYKRRELEEQIASMQKREAALRNQWESAPSETTRGSPDNSDLSLREREIQRRERELDKREQRLNDQQQTVENEAKFVAESEEQLNQRFEQFLEREAKIEQKEEDIQRKVFELKIARQ